MARRGGKASNRSARQRKQQRRQATRPAAQGAAPVVEATPAPSRSPQPPSPRSAAPISYGSRLSERAAAEYHYVIRDLRNIGILMLVIAALLAAATVAFGALGIGPA